MVKKAYSFNEIMRLKKVNWARYNEVFGLLDKEYKSNLNWVATLSDDGRYYYVPEIAHTKRHLRLLKVLNKIEVKGRKYGRLLSDLLGYTVKVENEWNDKLDMEEVEQEKKRAESMCFPIDMG